MQIICISRGSYGYSTEVAEKLAEKTGYTAISRETITDEATDFGIPVGKLEMLLMRGRPINEEMSIVVDMFKAFATAYICERALTQNIVYHGRTGHMVLPGLQNVLRIRGIADLEYRLNKAEERMHLTREKAKNYILQVDEDIRRWAHTLYNTEWDDPTQYDLTINAAHLSSENAASALVNFIKLPEFQGTPASNQTIQDLLLASKCRLAVGSDERTKNIFVGIHADKGNVSVTYMPRFAKDAIVIPEVLKSMKEIKSLVCTVATTNILWVGEKFNADADYFESMNEIATKWNAAIEIVRLAGEDERPSDESEAVEDGIGAKEKDGGILADTPSKSGSIVDENSGIQEAVSKLIQNGHSGGARTVYGGTTGLLKALQKTDQYSLVTIGDVFLNKGSAQQRLKRDMIGKLEDKFRIPVVGTEDLKAQYLFGPKQLASMIIYAFLSLLLFFVAFKFQGPILNFVSKGHFHGSVSEKLIAAGTIAFCIPFVATIIGGFYHELLKLVKIE